MVPQLVEASCTPKVCGFDPQSGHIPRLWDRSLVGACTRGNQWMMFLSLLPIKSMNIFFNSFTKRLRQS